MRKRVLWRQGLTKIVTRISGLSPFSYRSCSYRAQFSGQFRPPERLRMPFSYLRAYVSLRFQEVTLPAFSLQAIGNFGFTLSMLQKFLRYSILL